MKIDIDKDFGIVIALNKDEKEKFFDDFTAITKKIEPFMTWYETKASKEEKVKYDKKYNNSKLTLGWSWKVLKAARYTEKEIMSRLKS